ncbi:MAG: N-acetylmuramoyl-L-alanine amidase family protein [Verrucomicrobiales bacterium]
MPPVFVRIILTLSAMLVAPRTAHSRYFNTVVIDAGHGAHDFGCQDRYFFEKHLALDMARRLERYMRRQGYRTVMTRANDRFVPLDQRARMANGFGRSVLVSIHVNHARRIGAAGVETYYHNRDGAVLAGYVQRQLLSRTNNGGNRGVKFARFRVLRLSARPAVLVETGFISNARDRARLRDPAYREAVARSIALGLQQYRRH